MELSLAIAYQNSTWQRLVSACLLKCILQLESLGEQIGRFDVDQPGFF